MKNLVSQIAIALIAVIFSTEACADLKELSYRSKDRSWFSLTFNPSLSDAKIDNALYGHQWVNTRNDDDKSNDVKSLHVAKKTDQKFAIEAQDGSAFSVKLFSMKTVNVETVWLRGLDANGDELFKEFVIPRDMARFEKWEKTSFKAKRTDIHRLEVTAVWREAPAGANKSLERGFIRGILLKACPL